MIQKCILFLVVCHVLLHGVPEVRHTIHKLLHGQPGQRRIQKILDWAGSGLAIAATAGAVLYYGQHLFGGELFA